MSISRRILTLALAVAAFATLPPARAAVGDSRAMDLARQLNQAFIEVADRVSASVVVVRVAHRPDFSGMDQENPLWPSLPPEFRRWFEERFPREPAPRDESPREHPPIFDGQGSGVVIREDGYILTNRHVVEGADQIKVRFKDGQEHDAEVRGVDAQSDIAVLKVDATGLTAAKFADIRKVRVGEFAIAIGAPFDLDYTVTVGHVSAKGRSGIIPDPAMDQDFIQTDASINPGNSGGPLVNLDGEIIGINTMIRGLNSGIGFAIPSNLAQEVAQQLIEQGKFTRSWLGVEIRSLREDEEFRALVEGVEDGVVVRGIVRGGPASKSDLQLGDVIVSVDGRSVQTAQDLKNEIRSKAVDAPVQLEVVRRDRRLKLEVRPEAWPEDATLAGLGSRRPAPAAEANELGLSVRALTRELAEEYRIDFTEGVVVTEVDADGPAARKGLEPGDVITRVDRKDVATVQEWRNAIAKANLEQGVILSVVREGVSRLVVLKAGA